MKRSGFFATLVVVATLAVPALAQDHGAPKLERDATSPEVLSVGSKLACDCGCPHEPLDVCRCGTAQRYRLEMASLFNQGMDEDQVLAAMVEKYGSGLLAEPPNTVAGIFAKRVAPPLLALIGIGLVLLVIRRLRGAKAAPLAAAGGAEVEDEYLSRVDDELSEY
jgi:cytochrome c-type biogenesis protein CcmH/NrfF